MTQATSAADNLATTLAHAYQNQTPLSTSDWIFDITSTEQAYAVQEAIDGLRHKGTGPRYWKSGGASREAVLTHAALPSVRVLPSPADLSSVEFFKRGIEAEVALRLACDVTPTQAAGLRFDECANLVDAIAVTIEVVDSRWQDGAATSPLLKLADTQSHGALVVGEWQSWDQHVDRDWATQQAVAYVGNAQPVTRVGTHPMGHPSWLLPTWLRHATRHGKTVPAGTVVTTGSWVGILPAARGDSVRVSFPGIGETSVQL